MKTALRFVAFGMLVSLTALPASAQASRYPVQTIDFGIWCTEVQHYDWDRCDKRLPEDVTKFEAYRHVVERYEIPYLQEKDNTLHFDERILHDDPVDKTHDLPNDKPPSATAGP